MKTIPKLFLVLLFLSVSYAAAQNSQPFAELDRYVKTAHNGYFGGEEKTVSLFNAERKRLGQNFVTELAKYLGSDIQKYYWLSLYLSEKDYLQGGEPLPELALRIKRSGLALIANQTGEDADMYIVGLNVNAAILSAKLKKDDLAKQFKADAEKLSKEEKYLGTFPALSDEDRAIYESLGVSSAAAAQTAEPFAELDRYVQANKKPYDLFPHDENTVSLFNAERKRLGEKFEIHLFNYLGGDVDKYYWISAYLIYEVYLRGNKPLPELSLRIKQMGLEITQTHSDEVSVMSIMGLNVTAAILSKKLKKNDLAKKYKAAAEALLGKDQYSGTFPALNDEDREIYDRIEL